MFRPLFTACLLLSLVGCGDAPVSTAPRSAIKKIHPAVVAPVKKKKVEEKHKDTFVYSSIGVRDPFESLLKKENVARKTRVPKTPLEKFDLGQFRLQAIIIGKGLPRAMVSAPDGKNYILKPGLKIGKHDGVIKNITKSAVLVEETSFNMDGSYKKGMRAITLPEKKTL